MEIVESTVSDDKVVDTSRTDHAYWAAILQSEGLGMSQGVNFLEEDLLEAQREKEEREQNEPKNKGGQPRKPKPPKGLRPKLNKSGIEKAVRFTNRTDERSGTFQFGGFRHYGPSFPYGAGHGNKGGGRVPGDGHFIQYVGSSNDIADLEERIALDESGRVTPSGFGADR